LFLINITFFFLYFFFIYFLSGIPLGEQDLVYQGVHLKNVRVVGDYNNITKGTTIDLITSSSSLPIVVKTSAGKKIPMEVMTDETVASLKERIAEKEGWGKKFFVLSCLFDFFLFYILKDFYLHYTYIHIYSFSFFFFSSFIFVGIPVTSQNLAHDGMKLEDDQTIADYGLEKGSVVDLLSTIQVYDRMLLGKQVPLDVSVGDSIPSVKKMVEKKEGK
jgi:hypothetical protein